MQSKKFNLKSNMDRFIVLMLLLLMLQVRYLKSNMDRFIGVEKGINTATALVFKIQYG